MPLSTPRYRGYLPPHQLPIQVGDRVRVPAGTPVLFRTGARVTTRTRSVTVTQVVTGHRLHVGNYWPHEDRVSLLYEDRRDPAEVRKLYGTSDLEELWPAFQVVDHGSYRALYLPLSNPQVCWGGYSADINRLVPQE